MQTDGNQVAPAAMPSTSSTRMKPAKPMSFEGGISLRSNLYFLPSNSASNCGTTSRAYLVLRHQTLHRSPEETTWRQRARRPDRNPAMIPLTIELLFRSRRCGGHSTAAGAEVVAHAVRAACASYRAALQEAWIQRRPPKRHAA